MHQPVPPLNALRAFEAAARHLSVSKAAQELRVTASALSHQICGLEEFLGLKLFQRRVRSIALTPASCFIPACSWAVKASKCQAQMPGTQHAECLRRSFYASGSECGSAPYTCLFQE